MTRQIGVYFETWAAPWTGKASLHSLALVEQPINMVYLSFANPSCTYVHGQHTFVGTGLDFSDSFQVIFDAIRILKSKGIKVLLAVGGFSYWHDHQTFNSHGCVELAYDLGCDGIDLDWEVGVSDDAAPMHAIKALRALMARPMILSFTGFSTGAYDKAPGDKWRGMSIKTLEHCNGIIDQINVMAYDAGDDFDAIKAFESYRAYSYNGIVNIGFQVGVQGWGNAILQKAEVKKSCKYVKENSDGGCFIWAYFKSGGIGAGVDDVGSVADKVFQKHVHPKPTFTTPSSWFVMCPSCDHKIKLSIADVG